MRVLKTFLACSTVIIYSSCLKEEPLYRDHERSFNALIMQNKVYMDLGTIRGYFYGIQEEGKQSINTINNAIQGFDSLYSPGYQYQIRIHEICRTYRRIEDALMDALGCSLSLVEIYSKIEVDDEFEINEFTRE